jgi:hypothetical protein
MLIFHKNEILTNFSKLMRTTKRVPIACNKCRHSHLKCDMNPICSNCQKKNIICVRSDKPTRRLKRTKQSRNKKPKQKSELENKLKNLNIELCAHILMLIYNDEI